MRSTLLLFRLVYLIWTPGERKKGNVWLVCEGVRSRQFIIVISRNETFIGAGVVIFPVIRKTEGRSEGGTDSRDAGGEGQPHRPRPPRAESRT